MKAIARMAIPIGRGNDDAIGPGAFAMMTIRKASERGHANHGWLDSHHTFSFADYYDRDHMGFRALRVINDDRVSGGKGFGAHPHRDMEILSYVLEGGLAHKDSMGTGAVIRPGEVQRMSAGTGVTHSEHNASPRDPVHFLQIWLVPNQRNLAPSYEQKAFPDADKRGRLRLVASPDGADGSVTVHADAKVYAGLFAAGERATLELAAGRHAWVHVAQGAVKVGGPELPELRELRDGDGLAISDERNLTIEGLAGAEGEVLVFELG
jgi:quercetin 2,3-dioxygenase